MDKEKGSSVFLLLYVELTFPTSRAAALAAGACECLPRALLPLGNPPDIAGGGGSPGVSSSHVKEGPAGSLRDQSWGDLGGQE